MTTVFNTTFTAAEQAVIDALDAGHVLTLDEGDTLFTAYSDTALFGRYHVQDTVAGEESSPLPATALLDVMHVLAPVSEWHTVNVTMR